MFIKKEYFQVVSFAVLTTIFVTGCLSTETRVDQINVCAAQPNFDALSCVGVADRATCS